MPLRHRLLALVPLLVTLAAWCPAARAQGAGSPAPAPPPEPGLFDRVAVLGASLSDGFGLGSELEATADLRVFVEGMLRERRTVACESNAMFFMRRDELGPAMIERVAKAAPSLVLAVDFLFWYGYGDLRGGAEARVQRLHRGLELLDRFDCPLVVGDFPDVSAALEGEGLFGQPMITPSMVPAAATLARLNAELAAWAARRGDVVVVPVARFLARLHAGEEVELRGTVLPPGAVERLLQADLLHPTVEGTIAVLILAFDSVVDELGAEAAGILEWSPEKIRAAVMAATEDERREKRERERRREERRREREERRKEEQDAGGGGSAPAPREAA